MTKKVNSLGFRVLVVVLIAVVGLSYLTLTNIMATRGYAIKELSQRADELKLENKKLELEITKAQSISHLDNLSEESGLVRIDTIEYLSPLGPAVALGE